MGTTNLNDLVVDSLAVGAASASRGKVVLAQTGTLAQNTTTAVDLTFTLPANAQIIDFIIDNETAWDSGTSDTLSIGTASAGTQYASSLNTKTAGRIVHTPSAAQSTAMANVGANTSVIATVTPVGTAATAGLTRITMRYILN